MINQKQIIEETDESKIKEADEFEEDSSPNFKKRSDHEDIIMRDEANETNDPETLALLEEERYLEQHPEERFFKDLLTDAKQYQSYPDPPQLTFELSNQVHLRIKPLIKLLMHEFQEFLSHPIDVDHEIVFNSIYSL